MKYHDVSCPNCGGELSYEAEAYGRVVIAVDGVSEDGRIAGWVEESRDIEEDPNGEVFEIGCYGCGKTWDVQEDPEAFDRLILFPMNERFS